MRLLGGYLVSLAIWCSATSAQVIDPALWGVDNDVGALARSGSTLYVGGAFTSVGPQTGGGVPVGNCDAKAVEHYPRVAGEVKTVISDGRGGWFIGGAFVGVGGVPHANLAHILSDGTVSPWHPDPDGDVRTLLLHRGRLYVGGDFDHIAGESRAGLCAFHAASGRLTPWNADVLRFGPYRYVASLLVHSRVLYVGGAFTSIAGQPRSCLAALDEATGRVLPWSPAPNGEVLSLAEHAGTIYAGGMFRRIAGEYAGYFAALDLATGELRSHQLVVDRDPYDCRCDAGPFVGVLTVHGDRLYVGGSFTTIDGQPRGGLAAVDLNSGEVSAWDPRLTFNAAWPSAYCRSLVVHDRIVYVGGVFSGLGGRSQNYLGALDAITGATTNWVPLPNGPVSALALGVHSIYLGGQFSSVGPLVRRRSMAAFDLRSGKVLPWDPAPNGEVRSLLLSGNTVYAGGDFTEIGGQHRAHVAALDGVTGEATGWSGGTSGGVWKLALGRGVLYAAGGFSSADGQVRRNIAAFDTTTGALTPWNPSANDIVTAIAVGDSAIYAGGWFTRIGGAWHSTLACLDPVSGAALPWVADCDAQVNNLALAPGVVYAAGAFNYVNGESRDGMAAVDASTGRVLPWLANASRQVFALSVADGVVYAGGGFSSINGEPRSCVAAIDGKTGAVLPWSLDMKGGPVWALDAHSDAVYAGGGFDWIGPLVASGLAAISPATAASHQPVSVPETRAPRIACSVVPNPVWSDAVVRFGLPRAARVSLSAYDIQGRCVADLLTDQPEPPGEHEVAVHASGWPVGCYMYRLRVGDEVLTRKMIVMR